MKTEIIEQAENLKRTKGRINLVEIANSYGIKVFSTDDIKEPSFIAYDPETNCYEIYINSKDSGTRQRFSLAHELAHYILHRDKIVSFGAVGRKSELSLMPLEEREADDFAAEILMPEKSIDDYLASMNIDKEKSLNSNIVRTVAKEFGVSLMPAILRLKKLGYYVEYIEL